MIDPLNRRRHTYDLHDGRPIARLEWRSEPSRQAAWYLIRAYGAERLDLGPAAGDLGRADASDRRQWQLEAEIEAITSTPAALDAAERRLHRRPERQTGRFQRLGQRQHVEIYVTDIDAALLPRAVPELTLESVSDVAVLAGRLVPDARQRIVRRIALLGGRVVASFCDDGEAPGP